LPISNLVFTFKSKRNRKRKNIAYVPLQLVELNTSAFFPQATGKSK